MLEQLEEYHIPKTIAEAVRLLRRGPAGSAVAFAGDIDYHWWRLQSTRRLIDTSRLGLSYARLATGALRIGAATPLEDIVTSKPCATFAGGLLPAAARCLASPLKRSTTTLAALLVNAVATAEVVPALLVLDATVTVQGERRRTLPLGELFAGKGRTVLDRELLLEITVPRPPRGLSWAIERHALTPSDSPILSVVAALHLARGVIAKARLAVCGGVKVPARLVAAETLLEGEEPGPEIFAAAAMVLAKALEPVDDVRASARHRAEVAEVLTRRALARAVGREERP